VSETFNEMVLRVAQEADDVTDNDPTLAGCVTSWSKQRDIYFATRIKEELCKGQEPVAYVRYEVGVRPTFVPVIAGKCEVSSPKLHEFTPLYLHPTPIPAELCKGQEPAVSSPERPR